MAGTNNIVPYATGPGANVVDDATFKNLPARFGGLTQGRAPSAVFNKPMRMGSVALSLIGQIIADFASVDANDDGNVIALRDNFRTALAMMLSGANYARDTSSTPNVMRVALDPVPTGMTGFRSLFIRVANTNTGPVNLNVNNLGSRGVARRDGTPLQAGDLLAGAIIHVLNDPDVGQYVLSGIGYAEVQRLIAGVTLWVRPDGNDANDGSANSAGAAFGSVAGAIAASNRIATTGIPILIRLGAPGTYAAPGQILRPGGRFIIQGDVNNQAGYIIAGAGTTSNPPLVAFGTDVSLIGVTMQNTGTVADTVAASTFGTLSLTNVTFTMAQTGNPFSHIAAFPNGNVTINGGCIFASSAGGWARSTGGTIVINQVTITFSGTPAWSSYGVFATSAGRVQPVGVPTIAGTATGPRYYVDQNSIISSAGQGANFYPGSVAGTTATGGQYV